MKRIRFVFHENGTISTDAEGFTGNECIKETEKLLADLNPELQERKVKAEYHAKTKVKGKLTVHG